jgi:hypothetical protein
MKQIIVLLLSVILLISCSIFKNTSRKVPVSPPTVAKSVDTIKKTLRSYKDVITDKAITDDGLFKVHRVNDRFYFEIADSLLKKDILIVNRISKGAAGQKPFYGQQGYAGDWIGENVIDVEKGPEQKVFFRRLSFLDITKDTSENGMYQSIYNSNLQPIIASFDIKAYSPDSSGVVIDITDFIKTDNDIFFFHPQVKKQLQLGGLQADKSYIASVRSFPLNTEIRTVKTYSSASELASLNGGLSATYELNSSLVLLPPRPMHPRYYDERVGYFFRSYRNFDATEGVKRTSKITRWRLEPKDEDLIKYNNGELIEPKKPIIFYVDPATPKKWIPFIIQGVNVWQKAFEKAGFKKAIYALEAPANDISWSLEDARHNAIVYMASDFPNAMGPSICDPRSGEIIESHINWYHNVVQILHDWYMIQAGPNDPRARKMEFDDSLMGSLIQYVITHEVGHTLGLQHDFRASATIPVDSLRSKRYVAQNSHTPSIMDYARFNYVAQPEDSIDVKDLIPRIGVYDEWAIEWGYKLLPDFKNENEEATFMNNWIIQRLSKDKRLVFCDPSKDAESKAEDLGDDAMKAGAYGIKNLQRVMANLRSWTRSPNKDYQDLRRMQLAVINQYSNYISHVVREISGSTWTPKTVEQGGTVVSFISREKQREAVAFLKKQLFDTPTWLDDKESYSYTGTAGVVYIYKLQEWWMTFLVDPTMWNRLLFNETNQNLKDSYNFDELLTDLDNGIWKELKNHQPIEICRRNTQKIYVYKLINFIKTQKDFDLGMVDACTIVQDHIYSVYNKITNALPGYRDHASIAHLRDLRDRLKKILDAQKGNFPESPVKSGTTINFRSIYDVSNDGNLNNVLNNRGCWPQNNLLNFDSELKR